MTNKNILKVFLGATVIPVAIAGAAFLKSEPLSQPARELSASESASTVGGVDVTSFPIPQNNLNVYNDNHQMDFTIKQGYGSSDVLMEVHYNSGKESAYLVSTPHILSGGDRQGSFQQRVTWPLGVYNADVSLTHCEPGSNPLACGIAVGGTSTKTNIDFYQNIRVNKIWFHNTTDGVETTAKTQSGVKSWVDDNQTYNYWHDVNTIDAVFDCGTTNVSQFRFHMLDTQTVPTSPFNIMRARFPSPTTPPQVYQSLFIDGGILNIIDSIDPNNEYLHVFFVKLLYSDTNGNGSYDVGVDGLIDGVADRSTGIRAVVLRESMNPYRSVSVLAHELGHAIGGLAHVRYDRAPDINRNEQGLCVDPPFLGLRNIMCDLLPGAGRQIVASQCSKLHNVSQGINLVDHH